MRTLLLATTLLLAAAAGTVTTDLAGVHFVAAPGERNDVRANVGSAIRLSDAGAPIELASSACTREDANTVVCPPARFDVRLGDADDRFAHNPPYPPDATGGYQPTMSFGEDGDDTIVGYATNDLLDGGPGADVIRGREGDDVVAGGPGRDVVEGMEGDDSLAVADAGAPLADDHADGGPGRDFLDYGVETRGVVIDLARGAGGGAATGDVIRGIEKLRGGSGRDQLEGDDGPNVIDGGPGGGGIAGRGGDDLLTGGEGADTLDGGPGNDTVSTAVAIGTEAAPAPDDFLFGGPGDDALGPGAGGLADGGDGRDRILVRIAPERPLRIKCGPGSDTASVERRVALRPDCEWYAFGEREIEVHRRLRLFGVWAHARVRGFTDVDRGEGADGRLVLRHAVSRRRLASAEWRDVVSTPSALRFRPRIAPALARRIRGGRRLGITIQAPGGARARASIGR